MIRRVACRLAVAGALLAGPAHALAQTPDTLRHQADSARAGGSFALDTLRVEVTRAPTPLRLLPMAASAIQQDDIATARPGVGLDEVLGPVPGVFIANRENLALGARVTLRGFGARSAFGVRGVRIVADGIPLTSADGQGSLNNLDLARAGRVEVLRGPASTLYGNAAGGVIRLVTAPPPPVTEASARLTVGDEARGSLGGLVRIDAGVAGPLGGGGYRIGASQLSRDGVREHSAAEQNTLNAHVVQPVGRNGFLRFVLNAADAPRALNPGSLPWDSVRLDPSMAWPNNVRQGTGEAARQVQGGLTYERQGTLFDARVTAWGAHRELENPIPIAVIALERGSGGARAHVLGTRGRFDFGAGFEAELQRDDRREWSNDAGTAGAEQRRDQRDEVVALAPYVHAAAQLGRAHLTLAARWDRISFRTEDHLPADGDGSGERVLSALSPSAALLVEVSRHLSAYANFTSAFQTPTTTELANAPPLAGEACCPTGFNDSLQPERTWGGELGVRGAPAAWLTLDAAAFAYRVDDAIVPFQVEGIEERSFFRNAGETTHRGLEIGATLEPTTDWRVRTSLTALDVRFRDDGDPGADHEDNEVPGIPPLRLFADARWSGPLTVEVDVEHTAAYYASDANTAESRTQAATVLGARVHTAFSAGDARFAPFLALRNITDEVYAGAVAINAFGGRFFEPAAGRMLLVGLEVTTRVE
ncbi:MAG TPA: TonB-dependent receptor [Longimicrobiales bacterium]|nr:TonB-dependent receptor [Longimicrobiales bacterium]